MSKPLFMWGTSGTNTVPTWMQPEPTVDVEKARLSCLELVMAEVINKAEYRKLIKMLYSPDQENWVVADEIIKTKINEL